MVDSKIKTIIVEDDIHSQEYLSSLLRNNFSNIDVKGYATSIQESVFMIHETKPELVFMDIELTDGYSFEILDRLNQYDFEVIFVTGFDNYLEKAMDHFAFSYITKPIDETKLIKAVNRYISLKERLFSQEKYKQLSSFLSEKEARLLLQVGHEHISIKISDIVKCEAEGNYTNIFLVDKTKHLASNNLKHYESLFTNKRFFKAHRSVLINIAYIRSIYKKETIVLSSGDKIHVSVRNKSLLADLIKILS